VEKRHLACCKEHRRNRFTRGAPARYQMASTLA
jgi:hypothetical protein